MNGKRCRRFTGGTQITEWLGDLEKVSQAVLLIYVVNLRKQQKGP